MLWDGSLILYSRNKELCTQWTLPKTRAGVMLFHLVCFIIQCIQICQVPIYGVAIREASLNRNLAIESKNKFAWHWNSILPQLIFWEDENLESIVQTNPKTLSLCVWLHTGAKVMVGHVISWILEKQDRQMDMIDTMLPQIGTFTF